VLGLHAGATSVQADAICNDECRIKTYSELADQLGVFGLVAAEALKELPRPGFGDSADIGNHLVAVHANTVVSHGNGASLGIEVHLNLELAVTC
jgi:hypothetical protein